MHYCEYNNEINWQIEYEIQVLTFQYAETYSWQRDSDWQLYL